MEAKKIMERIELRKTEIDMEKEMREAYLKLRRQEQEERVQTQQQFQFRRGKNGESKF